MVPRIPRGLSWWRADQDTVCGNVLQDIPRGKCREVQWKCLQNLRHWQKWNNWLQRVHAGASCHILRNSRRKADLGFQDVWCRWEWRNRFRWDEKVTFLLWLHFFLNVIYVRYVGLLFSYSVQIFLFVHFLFLYKSYPSFTLLFWMGGGLQHSFCQCIK